jgi:hypothetical protein
VIDDVELVFVIVLTCMRGRIDLECFLTVDNDRLMDLATVHYYGKYHRIIFSYEQVAVFAGDSSHRLSLDAIEMSIDRMIFRCNRTKSFLRGPVNSVVKASFHKLTSNTHSSVMYIYDLSNPARSCVTMIPFRRADAVTARETLSIGVSS